MRAKVRVSGVAKNLNETGGIQSVSLSFNAVAKNGNYPPDGTDEDNTYAKWTPMAIFNMNVTNPDLFDAFKPGQKFYVDFTPAD